jgi:hypothetical protein
VDRWRGDATQLIDLEGRTVIPGLIESHGHLLALGRSRMILDLSGAHNFDDLVRRVASAVEATPSGQWILGAGWHQSKWDPPPDPAVNGFPVHRVLSQVSPSHPVFLTHASGHAGLANAMAIALAGITPHTVVDGDGEIIREPDGTPTGVFTERAQELIRRAIPEATPERNRQALSLAISEALENGITSFRDAGSSREDIDRYRSFLSEGRLGVRVWVMVDGSDSDLVEEWLERGPEIDSGNRFLTIRAFKLFADGALGSRGAWLLSPYADRPEHSGHSLIAMEDLYRLSAAALRRGFQLCVHAIGDRANREVLNQFERAFTSYPANSQDHRFRIEHAQHIDPSDIPRFARMGVIASVQGIHFSSDRPWAIDRLGRDRISDGAYPWQSLLASGAVVVNGTDAPVEPINPIASFYASVTRKTLDGRPQNGFELYQRMSRHQALKAYTLDAAFAGFEDSVKGSIEVGKLADFTVLSRDIMTIAEDRILGTRVEMTIIGGRVAYSRAERRGASVAPTPSTSRVTRYP